KVVEKPAQTSASPGGAPAISGLPPGIDIGGLENLLGGGAMNGAPEGSPQQEGADGEIAQDRMVEDYTPGIAGKYMPVDAAAFNKAQEKPVITQPLSNEDIRRVMAEAQDLTAANPVAEALRAGKPIPGTNTQNQSGIESVNPAARAMGMAERSENPADGNSVPTSEEASTAGKWTE
ncbi:MAG: hypothetical protein AB1540_10145, partial [Bdellovibrionota bacterium]